MGELHDLFDNYVYGARPTLPTDVKASVISEALVDLGAEALVSRVELALGVQLRAELLLVAPASRQGPAAFFVGLSFAGNDEVLASAERLARSAATADDRRAAWPLGEVLTRGYGVATLHYSDLVPDEPTAAVALLQRLTAAGAPRGPAGTGTLSWWSWGLSRVVDYLGRRPEVDHRRLAVFGHSRLGKAALLAGARDERLALVIAHQSGSGGAAPWRVPRQLWPPGAGLEAAETLEAVTGRFGYWFCDRLASFRADPGALPVEQHELIALCAPRPVLLTNASDDHWTYPNGQREMLEAAAPVYRLVCPSRERVIGAPAGAGVLAGERLGWFVRPGGHSTTVEDWRAWLDYADLWL